MHKKANIYIIIVAVLSLITISFIVGVSIGIDRAYSLYRPKYENELIVKAKFAQYGLQQLDTKEYELVHNHLRQMQDGQIAAIDIAIDETKDDVIKSKMIKLLREISDHRRQYQKNYVSDIYGQGVGDKIIKDIHELLLKYKS